MTRFLCYNPEITGILVMATSFCDVLFSGPVTSPTKPCCKILVLSQVLDSNNKTLLQVYNLCSFIHLSIHLLQNCLSPDCHWVWGIGSFTYEALEGQSIAAAAGPGPRGHLGWTLCCPGMMTDPEGLSPVGQVFHHNIVDHLSGLMRDIVWDHWARGKLEGLPLAIPTITKGFSGNRQRLLTYISS